MCLRMLAFLLVCMMLLLVTVASADLIPPGWVDYSGANYGFPYDDSDVTLSIPFDFGFYGGFYVSNQVRAHADGFLHFSNWTLSEITPAPSWPYGTWNAQASRIAAPMWHNFHDRWTHRPRVYYETVGSGNDRRFVITWDTWADDPPDGDPTQNNVFQAQLHEATGNISYHYFRLDGVEDGSRIGINKGDGVEYTGFWYDGDQNFDGGGSYSANQQGPTGSLEGWTITYSFNSEIGSYEAQHAYVPEPGTMALMLLGIASGIVARIRRS